MSDRECSFWFRTLGVQRLLGIDRGEQFSIEGLVCGVNLIHGPNGSGKTTTARAIQELIWPGRTGLERASLEGTFRDGAKNWSVSIDAGKAESVCDGRPGTTSDFGPPEQRQRYHLALHDLLVADNADFAKEIQQSSQGGFDLEAAAAACGFSSRPKRGRGLAAACDQTRQALTAATRAQAELTASTQELASLRQERDRASQAIRNLALLEQARELLDAREQQAQLEQQLAALPEVLGQLRGDERERLDGLAARRSELTQKTELARRELAVATSAIEALELGTEDVDATTLSHLRARQRRLGEIESDRRRLAEALDGARATADLARQRLGHTLSDDQLSGLDRVEIDDLLPFAREVTQVRAQRARADEQRRALEAEQPTAAPLDDADRLRDGITALSNWLTTPTHAELPAPDPLWRSRAVLAVSLSLAALSVLLSLVHHGSWVVLSIPALIVLLMEALDLSRSTGHATHIESHAQGVHRTSFEQIGVAAPPTWTVEDVADQLKALTRQLGASLRVEERRGRLLALDNAEQPLQQAEAALFQQRDALRTQLGLDLEPDEMWFPVLVENLIAWQQQSAACAQFQATVDRLDSEERALIEDITTALRPLGLSPPQDSGSFADTLQDLATRQTERRNLATSRAGTQQRLDEFITPELEKIAEERRELFEALSLDEQEEHRIAGWLKDLDDFRALGTRLAAAQAVCTARIDALAGQQELLTLDRPGLETRLEEQRRIADRSNDLHEQLATLSNRVDQAKQGFNLADCLANLAQAKAALADEKERGDAAVAGDALVDWVRSVAIETSRPQVFQRANELFVSFTNGALTLDLDDSASPPRFLARRGTQAGRPVDQLSVGERVQLLMAVRIAFLEQSETVRLPLLMDEVLGTSDDQRAGAIIDTVIEVARRGRQVFYFTAQNDEVGKWITRLQQEGINHRVINLATVRGASASSDRPLVISPVEVPKTPAPQGHDHGAYAAVLGVPALDPWDEQLNGLHLWHVIDDVHTLRRLLDRGVVTWSQFSTLRDYGAAGGVSELDERHVHRIEVTQRAIREACDAWRVGRGKPVDRAALVSADAVSETFLDRVVSLAQSLDGDAQQLIGALQNQEIPRWREKMTEALRDDLEQRGYLATEAPLSPDIIRLRVMATVDTGLRDGLINTATIGRIVFSLPGLGEQATAPA